MKPEDAELIPAPARNPDGTFVKGESGNPGGIPKNARKFQRGAAEVSYKALLVLQARLDEVRAGTRKMTDRNLLATFEMCAHFGGYISPADKAKLVLDARRALETPEEWDKFLAAAFGVPLQTLKEAA